MEWRRILKKEKANEDSFLALDIGGEIVKALAFQIDQESQKAIILGLGQALCGQEKQAIKQTGANVSKVILGGGSELVKGVSNSIYLERSEPKQGINSAEIKNILQKGQWKAAERIRLEDGEVKIINGSLAKMQIDGHEIKNPLGFRGKEITLEIFNTYALANQWQFFQDLARDLNLEILEIIFQPYGLASIISRIGRASSAATAATNDHNQVIVDVGSKTTEIILNKNGLFKETKTFALGGRALTQALCEKLNLDFFEAENIKIKYSQGKLGPLMGQKIKEILKGHVKIWLSGLDLGLKGINFLPSQILFCGGGSNLKDIHKAVKKSKLVQPTALNNIIDQHGLLKGPEHVPPLALLTPQRRKNELSTILTQTIRMMDNQ